MLLLYGCRLLQKLVDSQLAFQDVLKLAIDDKQQKTDLLRYTTHWFAGHRSNDLTVNSYVTRKCGNNSDVLPLKAVRRDSINSEGG